MIIKAQDWQRPLFDVDAKIANQVSQILSVIQSKGDSGIDQYALKFDQQVPREIELKAFQDYSLTPQLAESISIAANRIETFARFQMEGMSSKTLNDKFGSFGQEVKPISRVGAYIPGGRFPLISTALMTLIPAKIVGSSTRIACSPSNHPAILAAASLAGATQFIQIGGVQAIASLAFGYQLNQPVDLVVGPGNAWVNEAKKQLQSRVKIDGLAGPSELLAICDGNQPVEWVALDALAQAEHDPQACSLIISDDRTWLESMLNYLDNKAETKQLLKQKQIELIHASTTKALVKFSEDYAPEHLMLCHQGISEKQLSYYGSLFIGVNSAVALGDYISGPNHTLPTLGYARQTGGLNVNTFLRVLTTQKLNPKGRQYLSSVAMPIAQAEGLEFHYQSLKIRQDDDVD